MRMQFSSKWIAAIFTAISCVNALAHPGHSPADVASQVSQPFAGADHFVVFLALASVLLITFRALASRRPVQKKAARE